MYNYTSWPLRINAELRYGNNLGVTDKCEFNLGFMIFRAQYSVCCRSAGYEAGEHTLPPAMTMQVFRTRVHHIRHDSRSARQLQSYA
jgi:hypothetical protein